MDRVSVQTQPILLRYGTPRGPEPVLPGRYCVEREMWVVSTVEGEQPAMNMPNMQPSLRTKTATHVEQDDDPSLCLTNLLQTKTEAELEREDQVPNLLIAMLRTKTDAGREADDTTEMLV